jgi:adhesin/invasin
LDLIANYYDAISGFKSTSSGGREKALDGYDLKLNYHLSNKLKTDLFVQLFEWENPNSTYKEKGDKVGMISSIGNLAFEIGYLDDNKDNDGIFGSLKIVIPLGEQKENLNEDQRNTNIKNASVRNKLYMPVQRENKIKVVKISKSGVKISGF